MSSADLTTEGMRALLRDRRNWGRWGDDDQRGAINLIDDAKRAAAARLVSSGRSISLSRPLERHGGAHNPEPVQHVVGRRPFRFPGAGYAHEYLGFDAHNRNITHLDALCHIWDEDGMWGGRRPEEVITSAGSSWGDVDQWSDGIVTRGVLLDIPALRGKPFVDPEQPIDDGELERAAEAAGIEIAPGDAVCVYGGRDAWEEVSRHEWTTYPPLPRPGLDGSCARFIRDHDVAVLVWDLIDAMPSPYEVPWPVHGVLMAYGVALVDHAQLAPLAQACREVGRHEFMVVVAPLRIPGGTGSPVNPIAIL
jgi:kynurenine formamidase